MRQSFCLQSWRCVRGLVRQGLSVIFISVLNAQNPGVALGGLVSVPQPQDSSNLLGNPGFEQIDVKTTLPMNWTALPTAVFLVDATGPHSGQGSLRLTSPNLAPYVPQAVQAVQLKAGIYNFGGWAKTNAVAGSTGSGVRFCLNAPAQAPFLVSTCT